MKQLPPELLREIILRLAQIDQRSCLSTSRALHDIALAILFHTVKIFLGAWETLEPNFNETGTPDAVLEQRTHERSCGLLGHISDTPAFGRVVRRLAVYAYKNDGAEEEKREVLLRSRHVSLKPILVWVIRALPSLSKLTQLMWFG